MSTKLQLLGRREQLTILLISKKEDGNPSVLEDFDDVGEP